ncbi:LPS export ABC transporter permease LptF [Marinimicrobium alkaliphilum]|uniref:LPS export ABC transporter permease LptF n=1 Tax=Marinimicrobium alkaliphilum TaxID=2202654 RepID=UPI000DB9E5A0|nr:LPS export ABC transporter permease LptF [Marinimicrobium alkaliphilum]
MIIFRYLSREVMVTTVAVTSILLLIIMSGRFVNYLADAASGDIAVNVLFTIMGYRLPGFMELVIPLGFFLSILMAYGRFYTDSEMVVLSACGVSRAQLVVYTLIPALFIAGMVAALSLWISPLGIRQAETLLAEQRVRSDFERVQAGRFQGLGSGGADMYVETLSDNNRRLNHLFVAFSEADEVGEERTAIVVAEYGQQEIHETYGQRYLNLYNGRRYEGIPGSHDFQVTAFDLYGHYMQPPNIQAGLRNRADAKTTRQLMDEGSLESLVALQWRLSLPLLVLVAAILAVPFSHTSPRKGRYMKLLPAVVTFMLYLGILSTLRGATESGRWPLSPGLWVVHPFFLGLALVMLNWDNFKLWQGKRRARRAQGAAHA